VTGVGQNPMPSGPETAEAYEQAMPLAQSFRGLMRYLQKRAG
jgi:hypothetical protein